MAAVKILINRPDGLGDHIVTFPFIEAVRIRYPSSIISYNVGRCKETILKLCASVDVILRERQVDVELYDIVYDLHQVAVGAFRVQDSRHQIDIFLDAFKLSLSPDAKCPQLLLPDALASQASLYLLHLGLRLDRSVPIIGFGVISHSVIKNWPLEYMQSLIKRLGLSAYILIFNLRPLYLQLVSRQAFDLSGVVSLSLVAALLSKCSLFVSVDTGLFHLAGALGVPTFGLFGPTPAKVIAQYHRSFLKSIELGLSCSPCWEKGYETKCDRACMANLSVEQVYLSIIEFLALKK